MHLKKAAVNNYIALEKMDLPLKIKYVKIEQNLIIDEKFNTNLFCLSIKFCCAILEYQFDDFFV
jgi:hypothetical protein